MTRTVLIVALLLAAPGLSQAGERFRIHNDGILIVTPGHTAGAPFFSPWLGNGPPPPPHPPPGGGGGVFTLAGSTPPAGAVRGSAGLVQSFPGFVLLERTSEGFGPLFGSFDRLLGVFAPTQPFVFLGPDDSLQLSGIGTWVGPVIGNGTAILDGLKGVPWEIKKGLRSGPIRGGVLDLGPKLTIVGFTRVVIGEIVSYEELTQASGLEQVGRSLDWAAPTVFGPEIFFLAGVSATDDDYAIHDSLASFSGASVFQGFSDVAFTTDTFLANKLQDYLDQRVDRRADDTRNDIDPGSPWNSFVRGVGTRSDRGDDLWVSYGAFAGVDRRLGEHGLLGAFAGYRRTSASRLDASGSSFRSNDPSLGFYGSWGCDCGFQLAGASWYTYRDYSGVRRLNVANGFTTSASFDTGAHQLTSYGRASFNWRPVAESALVIAPRFAVQYSRLSVNAYSDSGAGPLDLNVGQQVPESLRTALGFRVARPFSIGSVRLRPELRGDWYHELFDGARVPVQTESSFFNDFDVETQVPERDFGKLGIGVTASFARCECVEVGLGFDTIVSSEGLDAFDTTVHVGVHF